MSSWAPIYVRHQRCWLGLLALATAGSCAAPSADDSSVNGGSGPGVHAIEAGATEITPVAGQTVFVPAYSAVAIADNRLLYQLAITLSVRNSDTRNAIVVKSVNYHDQGGRQIRQFLKNPVRVDPLAAVEFFIRESDTSGGNAASFLVEWLAEQKVSDPVIEAVMVGTAGNQGVSFVCPGRVVAVRGN